MHQRRIERTRAVMAERGIDWLLLGPSADLFYLTGYDAHISERLNLLVLPVEGEAALVVPTLEAPRVGAASELAPLQVWDDHERPAELVAQAIGDLADERVAVGDQLWSAFLLRIQAEVHGGIWEEAGPLLRVLRMVKDEVELAAMDKAARLTDEAWEEFIGAGPLSGLTERQALKRLVDLTEQRGLTNMWGICASGPASASPHHATSDRTIEQGDAVIFDWGGAIDGYYSDVTRTVHVGEPEAEFREIYDLVRKANQATLDAVRPGVPCEELDRTARSMFEAAGYGEAFLHRVGHGLGLEVHEEPYLVAGNDLPLAAGMVFSDEPGLYFEGRFGARVEDAVVCTADGGRRLNEATRELVVME
jgi:Xaa-Pro aminopeptidase